MSTPTCDHCKRDRPTTGAIINGVYGQYCRDCRTVLQRPSLALNASHYRDDDRARNARDLIQPWTPQGDPNKDFIREWPDEAKDIFSQEELEAFG